VFLLASGSESISGGARPRRVPATMISCSGPWRDGCPSLRPSLFWLRVWPDWPGRGCGGVAAGP